MDRTGSPLGCVHRGGARETSGLPHHDMQNPFKSGLIVLSDLACTSIPHTGITSLLSALEPAKLLPKSWSLPLPTPALNALSLRLC